jgi:hypothetical protein
MPRNSTILFVPSAYGHPAKIFVSASFVITHWYSHQPVTVFHAPSTEILSIIGFPYFARSEGVGSVDLIVLPI